LASRTFSKPSWRAFPRRQGDAAAPLQALIFDSFYDSYRGVIIYVRIKEGTLQCGQKITLMGTGATLKRRKSAYFARHDAHKTLYPWRKRLYRGGHQGRGRCAHRRHRDKSAKTGARGLAGYREPKPMVFCGLYPINSDEFPDLRDALDRLRLNDASLVYQAESSPALGFGFRCGFLGLLHMDHIQERWSANTTFR
jgi:GTP-binding protein LepA